MEKQTVTRVQAAELEIMASTGYGGYFVHMDERGFSTARPSMGEMVEMGLAEASSGEVFGLLARDGTLVTVSSWPRPRPHMGDNELRFVIAEGWGLRFELRRDGLYAVWGQGRNLIVAPSEGVWDWTPERVREALGFMLRDRVAKGAVALFRLSRPRLIRRA